MAEKNIASKSQRRNTELVLANRDCETSKHKGITVSVYARKAYGWKNYSSIHSYAWHQMHESGPLNALATLPRRKWLQYPPNMRLNGQQASLDILEKRTNPLLCQELNNSLVVQYTDVAMS